MHVGIKLKFWMDAEVIDIFLKLGSGPNRPNRHITCNFLVFVGPIEGLVLEITGPN